ncbi:MAG: exodeoxyribonuclease V subunit alpha [Ilumatobacteraceae bacterium]
MKASLVPTVVPAVLRPFVDAGVLGPAEVHLARTLVRLGRSPSTSTTDEELLSVALAGWAVAAGHVCLDLAHVVDQVTREFAPRVDEAALRKILDLPWPARDALVTTLGTSPLVGSAEHDPKRVDVTRPLVLDGDLLYLTRQWIDEGIVAQRMSRRLGEPARATDDRHTQWAREAFVAPDGDDAVQVDAVRAALSHRTVLLLGGPGTGKTYTIAAMLHALASRANADDSRPLRVALAAPTAKAAQQMTASISGSLGSGAFPTTHADAITRWAASAGTLHSLLGVRGGNLVRFAHDARHPLPYDVVVVDEVSMVSLPLMARLLEAVHDDTTLVLVGDPQQLQSIETGAVLGELEHLRDQLPQMVTLRENRRQRVVGADGRPSLNAIGQIASLMRPNEGEDIAVDALFTALGSTDGSVTWVDTTGDSSPTTQAILERLVDDLKPFTRARGAAEAGGTDSSVGALTELDSVRVLCAHRLGDWGVSGWNDTVARIAGVGPSAASPGRPVLVTRNDRAAGLNNGDTGIVVSSPGSARVAFWSRGTADDGDAVRQFDLTTLADTETAFAMTVHKAQGSQYDTVVFIVPPLASPKLQREMLYTAVSRAARRLVIVGSRAAIEKALVTRSERRSSLADRIGAALPVT